MTSLGIVTARSLRWGIRLLEQLATSYAPSGMGFVFSSPCLGSHRLYDLRSDARGPFTDSSLCFLISNIPKLGYFEEELQLALLTVTLKNASIVAIDRFPQEVPHVCRYWRTPLLPHPLDHNGHQYDPLLTQLYLDRLRTLPSDVTLGAETPAHVLQQFVDRAP